MVNSKIGIEIRWTRNLECLKTKRTSQTKNSISLEQKIAITCQSVVSIKISNFKKQRFIWNTAWHRIKLFKGQRGSRRWCLTVQVLLLGPDQLLGGGFADGFGQALTCQRVLRRQDPVVQRLPRVHPEVLGSYLVSGGQSNFTDTETHWCPLLGLQFVF